MKPDLVHALLIDVRDQGGAIISKKKLMWMLGRMNESPTVWQLLIQEWEQIAPRETLYGFEWEGNMILTIRPVEKVSEWAQ